MDAKTYLEMLKALLDDDTMREEFAYDSRRATGDDLHYNLVEPEEAGYLGVEDSVLVELNDGTALMVSVQRVR